MDMQQHNALLARAAGWLARARHIAVLTGAGISRESGIPTFRDAQTGLWAHYNPEDLATREGFLKAPALVWAWYDSRRNRVWDAEPNAGHRALVALETRQQQAGESFTLVTQNIDALHQRAGSRCVVELHGNITRYKCLDRNHPVSLELLPAGEDGDMPPRCPQCNAYVRPDVVWFGESLHPVVLQQACDAMTDCDVLLVVGTSGVVHPAAGLPALARDHGARLVEVNPEPSALTPLMDAFLQGPAGDVLPALVAALA